MESAIASVPARQHVELPPPQVRFGCSLDELLRLRRSVRAYRRAPVPLASAAQLLWAAQGISDADGHRTVPSAGAVYPLHALLVAGDVDEVPSGVYRYVPAGHHLDPRLDGDVRTTMARACLDQEFIADAALSIVLVSHGSAMQETYGDAAAGYVAIEAGCALQNVALQAVALELGSVIIGAFHEPVLAELLGLGFQDRPIAILTVGHPA